MRRPALWAVCVVSLPWKLAPNLIHTWSLAGRDGGQATDCLLTLTDGGQLWHLHFASPPHREVMGSGMVSRRREEEKVQEAKMANEV